MGAWSWIDWQLAPDPRARPGRFNHVARAESAAPASGSQTVHDPSRTTCSPGRSPV